MSGPTTLLATSAVKLGIAAVIVDGMVRDGEGLEALRRRFTRPGEVGDVIACRGLQCGPETSSSPNRDGVTVI